MKSELHHVHLIRAAASLLVCLFHLSLGNSVLLPSGYLRSFFSTGYVGIESFFILTGYVICFAFPDPSTGQNTRKFLLKRMIRIEPPYVASILLVLFLGYLSSQFTVNAGQNIDSISLLAHLFYLNNLQPGTYVNTVYWTLGIEFQFYLLFAFVFFQFRSSFRSSILTMVLFFVLSFLDFFPGAILVFSYLLFFGLGLLVYLFQHQPKQKSILLLFLVMYLSKILAEKGFPGMFASGIVVAILLFWRYNHPIIRFFSMISFSLYLTHVPVGGKLINLGLRFTTSSLEHSVLLLFALLASIGFAYIFYRFVERPCLRLAKQVRYNLPLGEAKLFVERKEKTPAKTVILPIQKQELI